MQKIDRFIQDDLNVTPHRGFYDNSCLLICRMYSTLYIASLYFKEDTYMINLKLCLRQNL
jgi:hypothetical protein